jgi:hypothetical protein
VLGGKCRQGGYLDMSAFIAEQGYKTGKGGYQKVQLLSHTASIAPCPQVLPTNAKAIF